ncbi:MAG: flagellar hook-basal body complex protein [Oscillospiraceae bacterium]|nr:flagellar hook-basal body complex protein [Oscillospiraceae bacterium]
MLKSLVSGVSGLQTHQKKMDVIGNNIANVNTTGYKATVVTFADIYYQTQRSASAGTSTLGGINPRQVGYGVKMNSATPNLSNNGYSSTDDKYSMAIDGNGFFQVMDGAGNIYYTRAGVFHVDEDGYLVNESGYHVLGISGESSGQSPDSQIIRLVVPDTEAKCSSATKKINGTNVTLSVSAPSDNTNMSVSFVNSEYPFATYADGILTVNINMDEQYESEVQFQEAINNALNAGGVTLPDEVELLFSFEAIPNDPTAQLATNTVEWTYSTPSYTCDSYVGYKYLNAEQTTSGADRDTDGTQKYAQISFSAAEVDPAIANPKVIITDAGTAETSVTYAAGVWTVNIGAKTSMSEINQKINELIDSGTNSELQALVDANIKVGLTCTSFVLPTDSNGTTNRTEALAKLIDDFGAAGKDLLKATNDPVDVTFEAATPGAYANDYKITFAYSSTYGEGKTKAVWDEDNLTITINNSSTVAEVLNAIKDAANGNEKKMLKMTGLDQLDDMNAAQRKAFFEGNPSLKLGDGDDSFFTKTLKALSTFNLTDGRYGSAQTWGNLSDVLIQQDGTIIGYHAVHGYMDMGRIDLATFDNPNGLNQIGGTMFAETVASGQPILNIPSTSGAGNILSGALEMSNVDLSVEFTDMITTQRGFQANSRTITVSDTLLEELLSLKR